VQSSQAPKGKLRLHFLRIFHELKPKAVEQLVRETRETRDPHSAATTKMTREISILSDDEVLSSGYESRRLLWFRT